MKRVTVTASFVLVVMALAATLVAGCGAGKQQLLQDYVNACRPYVERVNVAYRDIGPALSGISPKRDTTWTAAAETLAKGAAATKAAVSGFKAIVPPQEIKAAHDHLVAGLADLEKWLDMVGEALQNGTYTQTFLNRPEVGNLLASGNAAQVSWKGALKQQCKKLGVTIPWKWQ